MVPTVRKESRLIVSTPRVVFFGTPEFAVPTLRVLVASEQVDVAGVVTQPDRPSGRGRRLHSPPVKIVGDELGVEVLQVATLRDPAARSWLAARSADLFVVAAFGRILGRRMLDMPPLGALNVHASLLPKYRGASPVAAAILGGEPETGISLMRMDGGLDTGPVFAQRSVTIAFDDTTGSLTARLSVTGAELVDDKLSKIADGSIQAASQYGRASLTRPLVKEDGWIDWERQAPALAAQVRAMLPWPRAFTTLPSGQLIQITEACPSDVEAGAGGKPGEMLIRGDRLFVACRDGSLEITAAQPAGVGPRSAAELIRGRTVVSGDLLGRNTPPIDLPPLVVELDGH